MKKILVFVVILAFALSTVILAAPGDSSDPIVVLSYLNQRLNSLIQDYNLETIENIQSKVDELEKKSEETGNSAGSQAMEIVEIRDGEKIIGESGTELILRGGEAFIIGSDLGGITNVTAGVDSISGAKVPANNYLIIPRSDGRGVYTNNYAIFMVRGAFEIVK